MTDRAARVTGWWVFAGVLLSIGGVLNIIYGIAAIGDSKFFTENATYIISGLHTWGWVTLILGVIELVAAFSLFSGGGFGRWFGIFVAGLTAIAALLSIPAAPFWSLASSPSRSSSSTSWRSPRTTSDRPRGGRRHGPRDRGARAPRHAQPVRRADGRARRARAGHGAGRGTGHRVAARRPRALRRRPGPTCAAWASRASSSRRSSSSPAPDESYEHVLRVVRAPGPAGRLARLVKLADLDDHLAHASPPPAPRPTPGRGGASSPRRRGAGAHAARRSRGRG